MVQERPVTHWRRQGSGRGLARAGGAGPEGLGVGQEQRGAWKAEEGRAQQVGVRCEFRKALLPLRGFRLLAFVCVFILVGKDRYV